MIKYDKFQIKVIKWCLIISLIMVASGVGIMFYSVANYAGGSFGIEVLGTDLMLFGSIVLVCLLCAYIEGNIYLKKLEKYGYTIPYKKKDYGNQLDRLPINQEIYDSAMSNQASHSLKSLVLAAIYVVVFCALQIWTFTYCAEYEFLEDTVEFMYFASIVDLLLLIMAFVNIRQSDNVKYRDIFERDYSKKIRSAFCSSIGNLVVAIAVLLFIKSMAMNMNNYVFRAREATARDLIEEMRVSVMECYEEYDNKEAIDKLLTEGIYLEPVGMPEEEFWRDAYERTGQPDGYMFLKRMYITKQEPRVLVKYDGDDVTVTLENPVKKSRFDQITAKKLENEKISVR